MNIFFMYVTDKVDYILGNPSAIHLAYAEPWHCETYGSGVTENGYDPDTEPYNIQYYFDINLTLDWIPQHNIIMPYESL